MNSLISDMPRARPAGPDHHADGRQLIFGLNHRISRVAVLIDAQPFQVADHRLHQRGRRRDRIPRHHRAAGKNRTQRACRVAVDDDLAGGFVHPLQSVRIGLRQVLFREIVAGLHRAPVQIRRFCLLRTELLHQRLANLLHVDVQQVGQHAVINHVADQLPQPRLRTHRSHQLVKRHRIKMQVRAKLVQLQRLIVQERRTRVQPHAVFLRRLRIHRHHEVDFLLTGDPAVLAGPDRKPGGQALNVGRKQILSGNRYAHLEDGSHQYRVGCLAAGAVHGGNLYAEIVDHSLWGFALPRRNWTDFGG
jgi:hypothetical protein